MLLKDRVAIVSGIGADIVLAARNARALESVAAEVRALNRRALGVPTDIAKAEDCKRLVDAAHGEFGRLDVLVNNAFKGGVETEFEHVDMNYWRQVFDVNVFGSLQLTQLAIPQLKAQGGGSIVFIGSMSMRIVEPRMGGYTASKGALMGAAQTLARELGKYRIRVNSVVPGYIWSDKLAGYFRLLAKQQNTTYEAVHAEVAGRTALNHIPTSEEIADAVVFFASDLSRAITGQSLDVNGGHYFH